MTFGLNVTRCRRARGLSQQQLAYRLGWATHVIDDIEYDILDLTVPQVHAVAQALGVSSAELMNGYDSAQFLRAEADRVEREAARQAGYLRRENVSTLDAFCTCLSTLGFGVLALAIKTGIWGYERVRRFWRHIFG